MKEWLKIHSANCDGAVTAKFVKSLCPLATCEKCGASVIVTVR